MAQNEDAHEPFLSRPYRKAMESLLAPSLPEHTDGPDAEADAWRDLLFEIEEQTGYVKSYRDADRQIVRFALTHEGRKSLRDNTIPKPAP